MQEQSAAEARRAKAVQSAAAKELRGLDRPTARQRMAAGVRVPQGVELVATADDVSPRTAAAWGDGAQ